MKVAIVACLLLTGCVGDRLVREGTCPGGRVDIEKRVVDTNAMGRIRNTTIRTNACLD